MRKIDSIIIHCSATKCGADYGAADIARWHKQRGFQDIGYHYVIRLDGSLEEGRPVEQVGAHCKGWNAASIGICYIGGLDLNGKPADTRTFKQKETMKRLIRELQRKYDIRRIMGHRDTSPDLNGNGEIEPEEFIKDCPCFDVRKWLKESLLTLVAVCLLTACGSHQSLRYERHTEKTDSVVGYASDSIREKRTEASWSGRKLDCVEQTVFTFRQDSFTQKPVLATVTHIRSQSRQEQERTEQSREQSRQKLVEQHQLRQEVIKKKETEKSRKAWPIWIKWGACVMALFLFLYIGKKWKDG